MKASPHPRRIYRANRSMKITGTGHTDFACDWCSRNQGYWGAHKVSHAGDRMSVGATPTSAENEVDRPICSTSLPSVDVHMWQPIRCFELLASTKAAKSLSALVKDSPCYLSVAELFCDVSVCPTSHQIGEQVAKRQVDEMRQWAAIGASHRLNQLQQEQAAIYRAFPELRQSPRRGRPPASQSTFSEMAGPETDPNRAEPRGRRTRRRTMSAEARKRISDAQKARWAKQKANATAGDGSRKKR